ncbi:DUF397 domain-containing protein [Actinocrispum wychmicini]|uniref:Uncharacterized protein DUF397 n=1 Tax=Actinocrispum wychmicini TaxID=1213861 RepID=A0A4R2JYD4_9PSEU|nr:DUF397 domain-containing protein [Actinocrispum wychmicini]TCO65621.1 uncharacterized protein DUF397 [Actinocrispum wychmicini]
MTPELPDARWRKSSFSGGTNGNCVEVTFDCGGAIRDSKNPNGPVLCVNIARMVSMIKNGHR